MTSINLRTFVLEQAKDKKLSLRKIAAGIGVSHSYLSETLNGKKSLSVKICNRLADFLGVEREKLYEYIDLGHNEIIFEQFREKSEQEPQILEFVKIFMEIESEDERNRLMRLLEKELVG